MNQYVNRTNVITLRMFRNDTDECATTVMDAEEIVMLEDAPKQPGCAQQIRPETKETCREVRLLMCAYGILHDHLKNQVLHTTQMRQNITYHTVRSSAENHANMHQLHSF